MNQSLRCLVAAVLLLALAGCQPDEGAPTVLYYQGEVQQPAAAANGPLRVDLWMVRYYPGSMGWDAGGTRLVSPSSTQVFMKVRNTGTHKAQLFETYSAVGASPPAPPPDAYLEDQQGRRYPATGYGWSGEHEGEAPPGQLAEAMVSFGAIPRDVTALTMMWTVQVDDGTPLTIRLPVPLPAPQP